jgi:hypothetical protein
MNDLFKSRSSVRAQLLSLLLPVICGSVAAQQIEERNIVVNATEDEFEDPGGYGQPQWAERSRASSDDEVIHSVAIRMFRGFSF